MINSAGVRRWICKVLRSPRVRKKNSENTCRAVGRAQRYTDQQRDMVQFIFSKHNHFDADQLIEEMKLRVYTSAGPRSIARLASSSTRACYAAWILVHACIMNMITVTRNTSI